MSRALHDAELRTLALAYVTAPDEDEEAEELAVDAADDYDGFVYTFAVSNPTGPDYIVRLRYDDGDSDGRGDWAAVVTVAGDSARYEFPIARDHEATSRETAAWRAVALCDAARAGATAR